MPIPIDGGGQNKIEIIAGYFYQLGYWFRNLYDTIKGWIWPFSLMAWPFSWIYGYLNLIADNTLEFAHGYWNIVKFTRSLLDLWGLDELISNLWSEWGYFRSNPGAYIRTKVGEAITGWVVLITFPGRWVLERLQDAYPEIHTLLTDTSEVINRIIEGLFSGWASFRQDPWQFILLQFYERNLPVYYFISDPENWVKLRIGRALDLRPGFTLDFRGALTAWLLDKLDDLWTDYRADLYQLGEKWLRYFWEGV